MTELAPPLSKKTARTRIRTLFKKKSAFAPILIFLMTAPSSATLPFDKDLPIQKIAFGSCNNPAASQDYWGKIAAQKPDLWIWLGDVIYADRYRPEARKLEFDKLKKNRKYQHFLKSVPVIGTWDDHDYWDNDSGAENPYKAEVKSLFLDFLDEPQDSLRRAHDGIYTVYRLGPQGRRVKILLLDTRTFRNKSSILGQDQWTWLEKEIRSSPTELTLVVSSTQVLPIGGNSSEREHWGQYPDERRRLLRLVDEHSTDEHRFLILTGDRHYAEFLKINLPGGKGSVVEFMSSGLTHAAHWLVGPGDFRIGKPYFHNNFGVVSIDWNKKRPEISLEIHSAETGRTEVTHMLE